MSVKSEVGWNGHGVNIVFRQRYRGQRKDNVSILHLKHSEAADLLNQLLSVGGVQLSAKARY